MVAPVVPISAPRSRRVSFRLCLWGIPVGIAFVSAAWPPWLAMCLLTLSTLAVAKWWTFAGCAAGQSLSLGRGLAYLLLWPGMDARAFLLDNAIRRPPAKREWLFAAAKFLAGIALVFSIDPRFASDFRWLAGWIGLAGLLLLFHFGAFHLLSLVWRSVGIDAPPIVRAPILAKSLGEFWGRRWNLAFRDLGYVYVYRRLIGRIGPRGAAAAVFLVSGVVHDAVISLPARAGYGLPTLYFLIQWLAIACEKSRLGRRWGLGRGWRGWLFTVAIVLGPLGLLFHRPFLEGVIVPLLCAFRTG